MLNPETEENSQYICKCLNNAISENLWRKKVEIVTGQTFPEYESLHWQDIQLIYLESLFSINFIKNPSGADGLNKHWIIERNGGFGWRVEPSGPPSLPDEPDFFYNDQDRFVASYKYAQKTQFVDLVEVGFTLTILDNYPPSIKVNISLL